VPAAAALNPQVPLRQIAVSWQVPTAASGQAAPQAPQFAACRAKSTQPLPHRTWPDGQGQTPFCGGRPLVLQTQPFERRFT
jgi:hypothetical protein